MVLSWIKLGWAIVGLLALWGLVACSEEERELRFHPPAYQKIDTEALEEIFEARSGVQLTVAQVPVGMSGLEALVADKADLALIENSAPFTPGIRAVLPVYQSVLHLLVHQEFQPQSPKQPLKGASIYVADNSGAGRRVIDVVAKRQGLGRDDYQFVSTSQGEPVDFILYFGPIDPDQPEWYVPGYELVSLGKRLNPHRESDPSGVGYIIPKMYAVTIPALTYDIPGNEEPIITVAADTLLAAQRDLSAQLVYELTKTLIEQKPRFLAVAPHLFSGITESFDPLELSFPLHDGARRYLHRDEPGVLERYAESINLLVYIIFLLLSAVVAFVRWRNHRKKDRIDTFYVRALGIREQAGGDNHEQLLAQLGELEQEAFQSLIGEKLAANESFRIFTDLLSRIRVELSQH